MDSDGAPKPPPRPVRTLGGYELLERVGETGGSILFRARQTSLGRIVSVRVLPKAAAAKQGVRQRFDRQIAAASRLRHDNIVSAIDAGAAAGCLYVVFEALEGRTLEEALARGARFTGEQVLALGLDVARALDHVASNHLVHRNVVPSAIFLVEHGPAKLAGFDFAKVRVAGGHETWFEQDAPTARYTSPEQVRGVRGIDARADLYALGCVLYHAATGRAPFDRGTVAQILEAHVKETPADPRTLQPKLPEGLVRILDRLLRKDPDERYARAVDVVRDLESARAGRTVERGPGKPLWKDTLLSGLRRAPPK